MNFTVAKRDLEVALKVVSHTVSPGGTDISSHYLFRQAGPKTLELLSYNGRVFASCPVVAAFEGEGKSFTIEAKRIRWLLDAVPDDAVLKIASNGSGEVVISTAKGKNVFASLDPELFPYWDEVLKGCGKTATVSADRLNAAFTHAKSFIYGDESKAPSLCVAEFREGHLFSTDQMAVSIVKIAGMEESAIRVFGKEDSSALIAFLSTFKVKAEKASTISGEDEEKAPKPSEPEAEVEVWECEKALFLKRKDGAVFGESKFASRFPDLTVNWGALEDDHWVDLPKAEVMSAVKFLAAGAKWEDTVLKMDVRKKGVVVLSMTSANGKPISLEIQTKEQGARDEAVLALPDGGFPVSNTYLLNLLNSVSGDVVRFGITTKGKGGWIRVKDERGPDTYLTTVAWLKLA